MASSSPAFVFLGLAILHEILVFIIILAARLHKDPEDMMSFLLPAPLLFLAGFPSFFLLLRHRVWGHGRVGGGAARDRGRLRGGYNR